MCASIFGFLYLVIDTMTFVRNYEIWIEWTFGSTGLFSKTNLKH